MRMRVRNVHAVRVKGRTYYYHRHTRKRINAEPGTALFFAEVAKEDAKQVKQKPKDAFASLCDKYKLSPEFKNLAPRTKSDYDRILHWLQREVCSDNSSLHSIDVLSLRDKAFRSRGRNFANYVVALSSVLFNWGMQYGLVTSNPAQRVKKIRKPKNAPRANPPWHRSERTALLEASPPQLLLPIGLVMHAALRQGDIVKLPWSAYDGDAITVVQSKTGDKVWLPVNEELRRIIASTPRRSPIMCVNSRGQPWTQNGLRASFKKVVKALEKERRLRPRLTFHGLRHSVATDIAEHGGGDREIAAVLGHRTNSMAAHYSRDADRKRLARSAFEKLEQSTNKICKTKTKKL